MAYTGEIPLGQGSVLYYYGIHGGPWALQEIFSQIPLRPELQFHVIDPLTRLQELPYDHLCSCDPEQTLVIIFVGESHGYPEYHQIIDRLTDYCGIKPLHIVLYTGCMADSGPNYNIGTIVPHVSNSLQTPQLAHYRKYARFHKPTHHFVCLNRAKAWQRSKLVELLLDTGLDQYGAISYGTDLTESDIKFLGTYPTDHLLFPLKYQDRLPLLVDKKHVTIQQGFSVSHPKIHGAFFNVITETAYGPHPEIPESRWGVQYPTLTEKTYKCFLMGQMPVWLSAQYTVHWARKLGFDVFDDIINHQYDLEPDPADRVPMVAAEIRRLCEEYTMQDLVQLHHTLAHRLKKNYHVLMDWGKGHDRDLPRWIEYFNKVGLIHDG